MEQGNENGSRPQVEKGRDHYANDVIPGEDAGTPMTNGGSSKVAVDIWEWQTICFENGHLMIDREKLVQDNGRSRNRRKAA